MSILSDLFAELNDEQKAAVREPNSLALIAGPGSGKSATLVVKAAHLISEVVVPPQRVACITYSRETVNELRRRLTSCQVQPGARLFLGTVHGFSLAAVLRPFGRLFGDARLSEAIVATDKSTDPLLDEALAEAGVMISASRFRPDLTRLRRELALGEREFDRDDDYHVVVRAYERLLERHSLLDFERMVIESVRLLEDQPLVRRQVAARFPWLLVDEYQDLGGLLHRIVVLLLDAGVRVLAVGDPDQTIYGFTGASPDYFHSLVTEHGLSEAQLWINYRSGSRLIGACETALEPDSPRGYRADPLRNDAGELAILRCEGDLRAQVRRIAVEVVAELDEAGVPRHEMAILYRGKGHLLDLLQEELTRASIDFHAERDDRLPRAPIVRWLQGCAAVATGVATRLGIRLHELSQELAALYSDAGDYVSESKAIDVQAELLRIVDSQGDPRRPTREWLGRVDHDLGIRQTLERIGDRAEDLEDYDELMRLLRPHGRLHDLELREFAGEARVEGRVVLTTVHSAKGRQFDAVIVPRVQEGIWPDWPLRPNPWRRVAPSPRELSEARRLFYVALSRARRFIYLLHSEPAYDDKGYALPQGPSRFIQEIQAHLRSQ